MYVISKSSSIISRTPPAALASPSLVRRGFDKRIGRAQGSPRSVGGSSGERGADLCLNAIRDRWRYHHGVTSQDVGVLLIGLGVVLSAFGVGRFRAVRERLRTAQPVYNGPKIVVTMPALAQSVTEAVVTQWLKYVGDDVKAGEAIVEVSTDKAETEIPSPAAGRIVEIKVPKDETVPFGAELAAIITTGASPAVAPAERPILTRLAEVSGIVGGFAAIVGLVLRLH